MIPTGSLRRFEWMSRWRGLMSLRAKPSSLPPIEITEVDVGEIKNLIASDDDDGLLPLAHEADEFGPLIVWRLVEVESYSSRRA